MTDRERLIELKINFVENFDCGDCKPSNNKCRKCLSEKEADYLIEHGVIVLPCKVGDTVWYISKFGEKVIKPIKVTNIELNDCRELGYGYLSFKYGETSLQYGTIFSNIGKTVFLTREEAEKALKERESNA